MKKTILILASFFTVLSIYSQDISGKWNGLLDIQGVELRIVFNITKTDSTYSSTMDSPDQKAFGIPVSSISFKNSNLKIEITNIGVQYEGTLNKDSVFVGVFKQSGLTFPMNLSTKLITKEKKKRPQEPTKPYPYYSEDVKFENLKDNIILAGTLTLPKKEGVFPAVILISGSGPQNRDEELLGHKPFLILSDYLTKNGIAVLRFDDRGTAKSTGNFKSATSLDFATDVEFALKYLQTRKEVNKNKIGLIGHSEGGIIAPMVAAKSKDINFIVLLAGTGIRGDKLLLLQQELIGKASGISQKKLQETKIINKGAFDIVLKSKDAKSLKTELTNYIANASKTNLESDKPKGMSEDEFITAQVNQLTNPWMHFFIKHDPALILEKVKCSVLAINGKKDLQVPSKINLEAIEKALKKGGNEKVTIKELPELNHLFQKCQTGLPREYAKIEQTFSPEALKTILIWIQKQVK